MEAAMLLRPFVRQSTLLLFLASGLQSPAMDISRSEGPACPELRTEGQGFNEDQQERPEARPEHSPKKQEKREDKQERREAKQEGWTEHREKQEQRHEPPGYARPQPMPRPKPMPRPETYGQPGGTTQTRPLPHTTQPHDPGGTGLSHGGIYSTTTRSRAQAQTWERSHGWRNEGAWPAHSTWKEHRARSWESEHRTWEHRGGYGGYIIPYSNFLLHFGPEHGFRLRTRPVIHMGYPRFRYGNYWFLIVDPWPEFWSENWYANDDVYVDYNDGYYLHNRRHPGVSIAISVSL